MKPKKLSKKLSLNRKTIANLTGNAMTNVKVGVTPETVNSVCESDCGATCISDCGTCATECGTCATCNTCPQQSCGCGTNYTCNGDTCVLPCTKPYMC